MLFGNENPSITRTTLSRTALYWLTTALVTAGFGIPGILLLAHQQHFATDMQHLGYPPYFLDVLGFWKIAGVLVILAPRLPRIKEWAYAGLMFDVIGASSSRLFMGDGPTSLIVPALLALVLVVSWALRPSGRVLLGGI
jgi:uncharacterized membrane protein YphA (DoxX/SURF4 family)